MRFGRFQGESGQSSVASAFMCAVLVVFIAATTNFGKLVTEKIAMQNAVDLAAYAGAATQAGYMNAIRKNNQDTWKDIHDIRDEWKNQSNLGDPRFFCCACPEIEIPFEGLPADYEEIKFQTTDIQIKMRNIKITQQLNRQANADAWKAAQDTADFNYPGTKQYLKPFHENPYGGGDMVKLKTKQIHVSYKAWCIDPFTGVPRDAQFVKMHEFDSWEFKDDDGQVVFEVGIQGAVPNSPFMNLGNKYFGNTGCDYGETEKDGRCSLDVYALAEPFFGKLGSNIEHSHAPWEYDMFISPLRYDPVNPEQPEPLDPSEVVKRNGGNYEEYHVRFVGIFDRTGARAISGSQFADQIPYGTQMEH